MHFLSSITQHLSLETKLRHWETIIISGLVNLAFGAQAKVSVVFTHNTKIKLLISHQLYGSRSCIHAHDIYNQKIQNHQRMAKNLTPIITSDGL